MKRTIRSLKSVAFIVIGGLFSHTAPALDILLTDDDGCRAPGIQALFQALTRAGHRVTLVAPDTNNSGMGYAGTVVPGARLKLMKIAERQYCVGAPDDYRMNPKQTMAIGTPVDAVMVGLDVVSAQTPPDLVVSGINFGQNVGEDLAQSGTVNAALKALGRGVPAIAISAAIDVDLARRDPQQSERNTLAAMQHAAQLLVRVIAAATDENHAGQTGARNAVNLLGLPNGAGLNINYPAVARGAPAMVAAPVGNWREIQFHVVPHGDGEVQMNLAYSAPPPAAEMEKDGYLLKRGHIVISPLPAPARTDNADTMAPVRHLVQTLERGAARARQ